MLGKVISGAIGGGVIGLIFWYIINLVWQGPNGGVLAGWLSPWGELLFVALGAVNGGLTMYFSQLHEQELCRLMPEVAAELGLIYVRETTAPHLPGLPPVMAGRHQLKGTYRGIEINCLDVTTRSEGSSPSIETRTVLICPAEGLPEFVLTPWIGATWMLRLVGVTGVRFQAEDEETANLINKFSRQYFLAPVVDIHTFGQKPQDDAALRRMFTPILLRFLVERPGWSVRSDGQGQLFLSRDRSEPASQRAEFIETALDLQSAFVAIADSPEQDLPAPANLSLARQTALAQAATLGLFFGGVCGLMCGVGVAGIFFFGDGLGANVNFLFPVLAISCSIAGALIGIVVGRIVAPNKPLQTQNLSSGTGCLVFGGMAFGFTCGGILGYSLGELLQIAAFGVRTALFFGLAVLGLVFGGLSGVLLARAFSKNLRRNRNDRS